MLELNEARAIHPHVGLKRTLRGVGVASGHRVGVALFQQVPDFYHFLNSPEPQTFTVPIPRRTQTAALRSSRATCLSEDLSHCPRLCMCACVVGMYTGLGRQPVNTLAEFG